MTAAADAPGGDAPATVGPFRVEGVREESEAVTLLAGTAPDGRQVDLVLLGPGPSSDAATRDRFGAAVDGLAGRRPHVVLGADVRSPRPWVALPAMTDDGAASAGDGAPGLTQQLLAAVLPVDAEPGVVRGPQFSPYWRGGRYAGAVYFPSHPAPAPARRRRWWPLVALLLLLLLLLLIWWLLTRPLRDAPQPVPAPVPTVTQLPRPSPFPSPFPPPDPGRPSPDDGRTPLLPARSERRSVDGSPEWTAAPIGRQWRG